MKMKFGKIPKEYSIEQKCVRLWTLESPIYHELTRSLYTDDEQKIQKYLPIIRGINTFLVSPTKRDMITYRGSHMSNKQFSAYQVSNIYRSPSIGATTMDKKITKYFSNNIIITFRINKNCWNAASIAEYSVYPHEQEVLLPPYTAFKVLSKTKDSLEVQVLDNKSVALDTSSIFL
eukprot:66174_1